MPKLNSPTVSSWADLYRKPLVYEFKVLFEFRKGRRGTPNSLGL
jgi:hypothetical protein